MAAFLRGKKHAVGSCAASEFRRHFVYTLQKRESKKERRKGNDRK